MGAVFHAFDADSQQWIALKVARRDGGSSAFKERLSVESTRSAMLAIQADRLFVQVMGTDSNDPPYIAMAFLDPKEGWLTMEDLVSMDARSTLPTLDVVRIGITLLKGLEIMAQYQIVHNDLKPSNLFVRRSLGDEDFECKIGDFGVSTTSILGTKTVTQRADGGGGTIEYMSPEQTAFEPTTPLSDLHSMGSILWRLATGEVPFPQRTLPERRAAQMVVPARPPNIPEVLYRVLARALQRRPADRWSDARAMRKELETFATIFARARKKKVADARRLLAKVREDALRAGAPSPARDVALSEVDARIEQLDTLGDSASLDQGVNEVLTALREIKNEWPRSPATRGRRRFFLVGACCLSALAVTASARHMVLQRRTIDALSASLQEKEGVNAHLASELDAVRAALDTSNKELARARSTISDRDRRLSAAADEAARLHAILPPFEVDPAKIAASISHFPSASAGWSLTAKRLTSTAVDLTVEIYCWGETDVALSGAGVFHVDAGEVGAAASLRGSVGVEGCPSALGERGFLLVFRARAEGADRKLVAVKAF